MDELDVPEGIRAELIRGEIVLCLSSDITTNLIISNLSHQVPRASWHCLTRQDVSVWGGDSQLQPDLAVFEKATTEVESPPVMVVEVVTRTSSLRDYRTKRDLYAEGAIPAYLIVDPIKAECVLLTELGQAPGGLPRYRSELTSKFGEPIPVDLLGVTLDTSEFQTYG